MLTKQILLLVLAIASFGLGSKAMASGTKVKVLLDSKNSTQDMDLAAGLMNAFYLAGLGPKVEYNETGTIETTFIGIDQMSCEYEGLVDSSGHPSKTLLGTNYLCVENDSRNPNNKLSPGSSYHIMKAIQAVVIAKSSLVGAASFFAQNVNCVATYNVFPSPNGTRDYSCEFDVDVLYEAE